MEKKTKRWIAVDIATFAVGVIGLNVLAYNHARAMMHFTTGGDRTSKLEALSFLQKARALLLGVNIPRPTDHRSPSYLAADCRDLKINGTNSVTLDAWYCDRGESTPLVILFHGYSVDKTSLLAEAHAFLELGTSVMLVDFRGSGGSSESYTTIGVRESDDVAAVVRFSKQNLTHSSIVLFGQSMGAVAILRSMQEHSTQPDAVILEAVFDTMLNTVRNRFRAMRIPSFLSAQLLVFWGGRQLGFDGFRHNPVDYALSVHCPSLFMHGRDDPHARVGEGRRVFDAVPSRKEFVMFDSIGHESYVEAHPTEWRAAVEQWIRIAENESMQATPYEI